MLSCLFKKRTIFVYLFTKVLLFLNLVSNWTNNIWVSSFSLMQTVSIVKTDYFLICTYFNGELVILHFHHQSNDQSLFIFFQIYHQAFSGFTWLPFGYNNFTNFLSKLNKVSHTSYIILLSFTKVLYSFFQKNHSF